MKLAEEQGRKPNLVYSFTPTNQVKMLPTSVSSKMEMLRSVRANKKRYFLSETMRKKSQESLS